MKISTQKIAFIAMMSAFCVIGRLGMLALPNVQPITVVVIWMTLELGWGYGVSISILSILISNLLISMGPWTLYQMVSFALVCVCALLLRPLWRKRKQFPRLAWILFPVFAGLMGYLYGFIISLFWVFSMPGLNFWIYYANGILFDTYHALGNIAFWILLIPIFERLNPFEKLKK
ncbi:ECF transporter S component [Granulicatella adiacens]